LGGIAAQLALREHVPAPLVMVTVALADEVPVTAPTVQTPGVPVMIGAIAPRALVVAVTGNVAWYAAFAGAPVKATVGVTTLTVNKPGAYATVYVGVDDSGGA
jgi:hypothetical protein